MNNVLILFYFLFVRNRGSYRGEEEGKFTPPPHWCVRFVIINVMMKLLSYLRLWPVRIVFVLIGLALVYNAATDIYVNMKRENVHGRGKIVVTDGCKRLGPDWVDYYECKGEFTQSSGMVSFNDAVVRVTGEYYNGEVIRDVWRDQSRGANTPEDQQRYISGEEQRSLVHNLPFVFMIEIGLAMIVFACALRPSRTEATN